MAEAGDQSATTSQSSSGTQGQSGSGGQAGGTQSQQQSTTSSAAQQTQGQQGQQSQAAKRPDWVPESYWDATKNEAKGADFRRAFDELSAFKAADESRRLSLPQKPEDYKIALPQDFKPPEGVEMKFNEADPALKSAREAAKEMGLTQDQFSKLLGVYAGNRVTELQQFKAAKEGEIAKLGTTGPARIDAVLTWAKAFFGEGEAKEFANELWTAGAVQRWEKIIQRVSSQHGSNFSQAHRNVDEPQGKVSEEQFQKMTSAERLDYTRRFDQSQFQSNGAAR